MASLADKIGAARSGPIQRSVAEYGGHCTYAFTQCKPPVSSFISKDESTAIGVCESMAAHWIKFHADGGSMWNWLMKDGEISMAKLHYDIMQLQSKGILGDQDAETEAWLRTHRIYRIHSNMVLNTSAQIGTFRRQLQGGASPSLQAGNTGVFSSSNLARAIMQDHTGGAGCYKKLWLAGKFGQHVMALWVAQDITFFDANFGEFWFEKRNDFFNWFTKKFWASSLYCIGLSGRYELRPYAKAHWSGARRG